MESRPAAPPAPAGAADAGLLRALGLWDAVALIVGTMIGSGIFLMAGSIAAQLDSLPATIAAWVFGGALSLAGAVSVAELGAALPAAGGLYVYINRAYGPALGFVYAWSVMALIHAGGLATLAAAIGLHLGPLLGLAPAGIKALQLATIVFFVVINCLGVVVGKWVQNALTLAKVLGLVAMTALLYWKGSGTLLASQWTHAGTATTWAAFGAALMAVLWAYDGWHFVSFAAGEVREPARTLPKSLLVGTAITCAIYLVVNVSYYAVLPLDVLRGNDRVAAAAIGQIFGQGAAVLISLLIAVSILGAMNGIMLGAARVIMAMAQDGLFFRALGRVSPRFRTPVVATVVQGGWAALFTLVGSFQELFTSYVFTAWIFYGLTVGGVLILRRREPELARPYRCPWYPVAPLFFLVATLGIVGSAFVTAFWQALAGVGMILLGVPLYFIFRLLNRKDAAPRLS